MVPSPVSWPGVGWQLYRPSLLKQLCAPDLLTGAPLLPLQMGAEAWGLPVAWRACSRPKSTSHGCHSLQDFYFLKMFSIT